MTTTLFLVGDGRWQNAYLRVWRMWSQRPASVTVKPAVQADAHPAVRLPPHLTPTADCIDARGKPAVALHPAHPVRGRGCLLLDADPLSRLAAYALVRAGARVHFFAPAPHGRTAAHTLGPRFPHEHVSYHPPADLTAIAPQWAAPLLVTAQSAPPPADHLPPGTETWSLTADNDAFITHHWRCLLAALSHKL